MSFELHRADIAQRLMQPLPIREHLDELEHLRAGFLPQVVSPVMNQLVLSVLKKLSTTALSSQLPLRLMLATRPVWASTCW